MVSDNNNYKHLKFHVYRAVIVNFVTCSKFVLVTLHLAIIFSVWLFFVLNINFVGSINMISNKYVTESKCITRLSNLHTLMYAAVLNTYVYTCNKCMLLNA